MYPPYHSGTRRRSSRRRRSWAHNAAASLPPATPRRSSLSPTAHEFVPGAAVFGDASPYYTPSPLSYVQSAYDPQWSPSPQPPRQFELDDDGFPFLSTARPYYRDEWTAEQWAEKYLEDEDIAAGEQRRAGEHARQRFAYNHHQHPAQSYFAQDVSNTNPSGDGPVLGGYATEESLARLDALKQEGEELVMASNLSFFQQAHPYSFVPNDGHPVCLRRRSSIDRSFAAAATAVWTEDDEQGRETQQTTEKEKDGFGKQGANKTTSVPPTTSSEAPAAPHGLSVDQDARIANQAVHYLSPAFIASMTDYADQSLFNVLLPPSGPGRARCHTAAAATGQQYVNTLASGELSANFQPAGLGQFGVVEGSEVAGPVAASSAAPPKKSARRKSVRFVDEVDPPLLELEREKGREVEGGGPESRVNLNAGKRQDKVQEGVQQDDEELSTQANGQQGKGATVGKRKWVWVRGLDGKMVARRSNRNGEECEKGDNDVPPTA